MAALTLDVQGKWFPAVGDAPVKSVLAPLRLAVEPGQRLAIIGPSGCGKTTLLNIVAGLEHHYDGRLELAAGTRLAYVFQEPRLLPWRTVARPTCASSCPRRRIRRPHRRALAEVGLEATRQVYASRLSLGMARRASLARAFVVGPGCCCWTSRSSPSTSPRPIACACCCCSCWSATGDGPVRHPLPAGGDHDRGSPDVLSASPARVLSLHDVPLGPAERRQPALVEAFRNHLLDTDRQLGELLLPSWIDAAVPEGLAP